MKRLMFEIQGGGMIYKAEALSTKWECCLKGAEAFYKAGGYLQGGGVLRVYTRAWNQQTQIHRKVLRNSL
jgi:hypothetical protein